MLMSRDTPSLTVSYLVQVCSVKVENITAPTILLSPRAAGVDKIGPPRWILEGDSWVGVTGWWIWACLRLSREDRLELEE